MPTINKRFLLKLLLVLFASIGVLFAAHAVQARRIPAALKIQSERAADAGKLDLAIHYLRQYLEFEPDDAGALVELSDLLAKRAADPARRTIGTALPLRQNPEPRPGPARHPPQSARGQHLLMGRYSDAVTHAEALLKEFPTEAALWQQLAAAQTGLNELRPRSGVLRKGHHARPGGDDRLPAARATRVEEHERRSRRTRRT